MCNPPIMQREYLVMDRLLAPATIDSLSQVKTDLERKLTPEDIASIAVPTLVYDNSELYWVCAEESTISQAQASLPYAYACLSAREALFLSACHEAGRAQVRYDDARERALHPDVLAKLKANAEYAHASKDEAGERSAAQSYLVMHLEKMPLFTLGPSSNHASGRHYFLPRDVFDGDLPLDFLKTL